MDTKALAQALANCHKTRDPFRIAEDLGMVVICTPLFGMRGLRQNVHRRIVIYVNSNLDEHQQSLVCAHELGHHFLHRRMNRIFMDRCTRMASGRIENEAHHFSVDLLYDDYDLQSYLEYPIQAVADCLGVSVALAEYRMQSVQPIFYPNCDCP